jgi:hypothetical protein
MCLSTSTCSSVEARGPLRTREARPLQWTRHAAVSNQRPIAPTKTSSGSVEEGQQTSLSRSQVRPAAAAVGRADVDPHRLVLRGRGMSASSCRNLTVVKASICLRSTHRFASSGLLHAVADDFLPTRASLTLLSLLLLAPAIMYFSNILMITFAVGALGDKAPAVPQLAAVADAVAPPGAADAPVLRGRGKDAAMAAAALAETIKVAWKGGEDTATVSEAVVALEKASEIVSGGGGFAEVTAAKITGATAGVRGAAADENVSAMVGTLCRRRNPETTSFGLF